MTTKTTHTPAPWKSRDAVVLHGIEKLQDCAILDGENCIIGECFKKVGRTSEGRFLYRLSQANAAHIVRCVNEREELLDLVRQAYGRWTDNDMVPPNHLLQVWLAKTEALLLADARAESEG